MSLVVRRHRSSPVVPVLLALAALVVVLLLVGIPGCGGASVETGGQPEGAEAPAGDSPSTGLGLAVPGSDRGGAPEPSKPARPVVRGFKDAGQEAIPPEDPFESAMGAHSGPSAERLAADVETIIANGIATAAKESKGKANENNCAVSLMALDLATGEVLLRRLPDLPLIPASNLKLMTAAAALAGLGPDGAFVTPFEAVGEVRDGVLEGDLVVRAGGDPLYRVDGDGSLKPWLLPLAQSLRAAGIERVAGALVLDEGDWLKPAPAIDWPSSSDHWQMYCALAGGFTVNGGSFRATVTPLPKSGKVDVVLRPRSHGLQRKGSVKIGKRNAVNVGANSSGVTVRGTIPGSSDPLVSEFSAPDPVDLFGHGTLGWLANNGIAIDGGFVRTRNWEPKGPVVHVIRTPILEVLAPILRDSHNAVADQLFLALGAQTEGAGTREAAARAVRNALKKIKVPSEGLVQVDGSGLSKANRTNAIQLVALVAAVLKTGGKMADAFVDALPVAGQSGSLKRRMRGTPAEGRVRAKTGWVSGASSLSGVATTLSGRSVVFSILVSYPRISGLNTSAWKPMQDEICEALVEWDPEKAQ